MYQLCTHFDANKKNANAERREILWFSGLCASRAHVWLQVFLLVLEDILNDQYHIVKSCYWICFAVFVPSDVMHCRSSARGIKDPLWEILCETLNEAFALLLTCTRACARAWHTCHHIFLSVPEGFSIHIRIVCSQMDSQKNPQSWQYQNTSGIQRDWTDCLSSQ